MNNLIFMLTKISPYLRLARLDAPTGIWLLYIPCLFGLLLAKFSNLWLYLAFLLGAILMRSAGCVINDIFDRKIDAKVERTKNRPLASGELSLPQALLFMIGLLIVSLCILLSLNYMTIILGLSIVPFVVAYPLMKRITYYPQIFLGITFNFGVLMGYAAATGNLTIAPVLLYIGCIFWTIGYDTIYAMQDIEDDVRVGVKSTAIAFGAHLQSYVLICYFAFLLSFALAAGYAGLISSLTIAIILLASGLLFWQAAKADAKNPRLCLNLFKLNIFVGILLALGLIL